YNPDATVEEIKWALIQSAQDLGETGEDNAYGYGFVNASNLLDYLPSPNEPSLALAGHTVAEGTTFPNSQFDLQLVLTNSKGNLQTVEGRLSAPATPGVTILEDTRNFYFGVGGVVATNSTAYTVAFDGTINHGQEIPFTLYLQSGGTVYESIDYVLIAGIAPHGEMGDHSAGRVEFTVSDFGQYGMAAGSIYGANGTGFRYNGGDNLLYEAGIIVARNEVQLSSSVRGADGALQQSDFVPIQSLSSTWTGMDQGYHRSARMEDSASDVTIPVTVSQESIDYGVFGDDGMVIMKYYLINNSLERQTNLHFGFLADFDLPGSSDIVSMDESLEFIYQQGESGPLTGLVALSGISAFKSVANGASKIGFSRADKFALVSSGSDIHSGLVDDPLLVVSGGPFDLESLDSVEISLALIAADNFDQLITQAVRVKERYAMPTSVDEGTQNTPSTFSLNQNYPNPFNPSTTISFSLPGSGEISLVVYNMLGQQVRELLSGQFQAGTHSVEWDGSDDTGRQVASGVYFYRLNTEENCHSRKMVLLR
ncbi:MAG: hypothetical protein DRP45_09665, partial [Candidatus Zixiibacteriota bacterium]